MSLSAPVIMLPAFTKGAEINASEVGLPSGLAHFGENLGSLVCASSRLFYFDSFL